MKLVVAYVDPERFEQIRGDLLGLGFLSLSVLNASGSVPESIVAATYRGADVERHLRPKARLECVVGAEHVQTVIDAVIKDGGERSFVFVVPVEQAQPTDTIKSDAAAVPGAA